MSNINLLTRQDTSLLKKQKTLKILKMASLVSLSVVAIFSILIFFLKLGSPLSQLKKDEASLIAQIGQSANLIVELNIEQQKIKTIEEIISKRPDFSKSIEIVTGNLFQNVSLDNVELSGNHFSVSVSSPTLLPIDNLINAMTQLEDKKVFKKVSLGGITVTTTGYSTSMNVDY